jgi:hypothetical protein
MNDTKSDIVRRSQRRHRALIVAALLPMSWSCIAQVTVATSASARYEYESNVFDLQSGLPVPGTTDYQRSDRLFTYGAALDANYLWDRQKFFARLSDNEFNYDHFSVLDHNEYSVDTGLNWKLLRSLDGTLEVQRNRSMLAFTNVNNAQFDLQTEQRELAKVGYAFTPDWRVEGSGYYRTVDQVFVNAPALDLRESSETLAIQYLGRAGLTAGFSGAYIDGNYSGPSAAFNPSYTQNTFSATALYAPSGRSSINGIVGYSERKSATSLNSLSGFTGEIDYDNQLTGKTTVHLLLNRSINSYVSNASSEIDSIATLKVRWQTTYTLGVILGYNWTQRELPGQGSTGVNSNRLDHLQYVSLNMDYQPARWLTLKPYFNYQTRNSNVAGGSFNATIYGILFTVTWPIQRQPDVLLQRLNQPASIQ